MSTVPRWRCFSKHSTAQISNYSSSTLCSSHPSLLFLDSAFYQVRTRDLSFLYFSYKGRKESAEHFTWLPLHLEAPVLSALPTELCSLAARRRAGMHKIDLLADWQGGPRATPPSACRLGRKAAPRRLNSQRKAGPGGLSEKDPSSMPTRRDQK